MGFPPGRGVLVVALAAVTVAAAGGVAAALRAADGGTAALAPVAPVAGPPSPGPTTTLPSVASPSGNPSPTRPSPVRTSAPTRSPSPSRTASPTPTATGPAKGMVLVVIRNSSKVTADVTINGGHWVVAAGTTRTVEAKPDGAGHDEIQVRDANHDGCGMGDSGWYLKAGTTSTLDITPTKNCIQGGQAVASLTWAVSPDVSP